MKFMMKNNLSSVKRALKKRIFWILHDYKSKRFMDEGIKCYKIANEQAFCTVDIQ